MASSFMSDEAFRVECSIREELTKATVALREQFRQQLVLERQDRQVSVAELRRDMEAQHAAIDRDRGSDASSEAPTVGAMAAASAMLQSSTMSRVSQKVEKLREEVFAGLAQLRSDFEEHMRLAIRSEDLSKEGDGSIATAHLISAQQDALLNLKRDFHDQQSQQNVAMQAFKEVTMATAVEGEQLAVRTSAAETAIAELRQNLNRHMANLENVRQKSATQSVTNQDVLEEPVVVIDLRRELELHSEELQELHRELDAHKSRFADVLSASDDLSMKSELHSHFVGLKETVMQLRSDVALHSDAHSDLIVQKAQVESLRQEVSRLQSEKTSTSVAMEADAAAKTLMDDRLASVEADVRKIGVRASRMEEVANLAQAVVTLTQQSQEPIIQDVVAFRNFMRTADARLNNAEKRMVRLENTQRTLVNLNTSQGTADKFWTELDGMDTSCTISVKGSEFASSDTAKDGSEAAMREVKDIDSPVMFEKLNPVLDKSKGLHSNLQPESTLPEAPEEHTSTQVTEGLMSNSLKDALSGLVTKIHRLQSDSKGDARSLSPIKPSYEATSSGKLQPALSSPMSQSRTVLSDKPVDLISVSTDSSTHGKAGHSVSFPIRRMGSVNLKGNPEVNTARADVPRQQVSTSVPTPTSGSKAVTVQTSASVYENAASQVYTGRNRSALSPSIEARRPSSHLPAQGLSQRVTPVRTIGHLNHSQQSPPQALRQTSGNLGFPPHSPPPAMRQGNPHPARSSTWSSTNPRGRPQNPSDTAMYDI